MIRPEPEYGFRERHDPAFSFEQPCRIVVRTDSKIHVCSGRGPGGSQHRSNQYASVKCKRAKHKKTERRLNAGKSAVTNSGKQQELQGRKRWKKNPETIDITGIAEIYLECYGYVTNGGIVLIFENRRDIFIMRNGSRCPPGVDTGRLATVCAPEVVGKRSDKDGGNFR